MAKVPRATAQRWGRGGHGRLPWRDASAAWLPHVKAAMAARLTPGRGGGGVGWRGREEGVASRWRFPSDTPALLSRGHGQARRAVTPPEHTAACGRGPARGGGLVSLASPSLRLPSRGYTSPISTHAGWSSHVYNTFHLSCCQSSRISVRARARTALDHDSPPSPSSRCRDAAALDHHGLPGRCRPRPLGAAIYTALPVAATHTQLCAGRPGRASSLA